MEEEKKKRGEERQLVVFKLDEEEFGVEISEIREIIKMQEITRIPNTPFFIEGVLNLRGRIIVVINLNRKLGLQEKEKDNNTRIIVIENEDTVLGMVVDSANEVLRISEDNIRPAPSIITQKINTEYLQGVAILDERLIILLDLSKVLLAADMENIQQVQDFAKLRQPKTASKEQPKPEEDKKKEDKPAEKETEIKEEKTVAKENPKDTEEQKTDTKQEVPTKNSKTDDKPKKTERPKAENKEASSPKTKKDTKKTDSDPKTETKKQEIKPKTDQQNDLHEKEHNRKFEFADGSSVSSMTQMKQKLESVDENTFIHHVNEYRNDIAHWVQDVVDDKDLAEKIKLCKDKKEILAIMK